MNICKTTVAAGLALGLSAVAQAEIIGTISVTSNYVSRGVTQTNNQAAVQGGLEYKDPDGLYAGVWGSNITDGTEIDLKIGFQDSMKGFDYDINLVRYEYPQASSDVCDPDYTELSAQVSTQHGIGEFTAGISYTLDSDTPDHLGKNDTNIEGDMYYFVSAGMPLRNDWHVEGTLGYYDYHDNGDDHLGKRTTTSYKHIQVALDKDMDDLGAMTFALSKADKDSGDDDPLVSVAWSQHF